MLVDFRKEQAKIANCFVQRNIRHKPIRIHVYGMSTVTNFMVITWSFWAISQLSSDKPKYWFLKQIVPMYFCSSCSFSSFNILSYISHRYNHFVFSMNTKCKQNFFCNYSSICRKIKKYFKINISSKYFITF